MTRLFNKSEFQERRRELRKNSTTQENCLWEYLRNKKLNYKFYRQYGIGPYIADFYCPKLKLVIEIDGNSHISVEAQIYDKDRTDFLLQLGCKVIRFWNSDIDTHIEDVIILIKVAIKELSPNPSLNLREG